MIRLIARNLVLGAVTMLVLSWGLSAVVLVPPMSASTYAYTEFERLPASLRQAAIWVNRLLPVSGGTIASNGPHKEPYQFRIERFGVDRVVWFCKGRAYSSYVDSAIGPDGISDASLRSWSVASTLYTHESFSSGAAPLPAKLRALVERRPLACWGVAEERWGWPLRCFKWQVAGVRYDSRIRDGPERLLPEDGQDSFYQWRGAYELPRATPGLATVRAVPLAPIWPGLIANTLLFACAWTVLLLVPRRIVLYRRARRGLCPSCGYDLRGGLSGGCPECGSGRADGSMSDEMKPTA